MKAAQIVGASLGVVLISLSGHVRAQAVPDPEPQWELGAGIGVLSLADYPGSNHQHEYLLPLPYIVYRGDSLTADREGVRERLFGSDAFELEMSMSGSAPVRSADDPARAGMPNLDPTFEAGPLVRWHLTPRDAPDYQVDIRLPVRFVVAIDSSRVYYVGSVFSPAVNFDSKRVIGNDWNLGVNVGPSFANRAYDAYYYSVAAPYVTAERPLYSARGGYSGMQITTAVSRERGNYWVGAFVRVNDIAGTVFRDSPLIRQSVAASAGIGFAYIFAKSSNYVDASGKP